MNASGYFRSWLMVAGMVCSMTAAQLSFKMAGIKMVNATGTIETWILNSWLWIALIASGLGLIFWSFALRRLSLSIAYPWTALIYVLTPLLSAIIFQDLLSIQYVFGIALIVLGVFITTSDASRSV